MKPIGQDKGPRQQAGRKRDSRPTGRSLSPRRAGGPTVSRVRQCARRCRARARFGATRATATRRRDPPRQARKSTTHIGQLLKASRKLLYHRDTLPRSRAPPHRCALTTPAAGRIVRPSRFPALRAGIKGNAVRGHFPNPAAAPATVSGEPASDMPLGAPREGGRNGQDPRARRPASTSPIRPRGARVRCGRPAAVKPSLSDAKGPALPPMTLVNRPGRPRRYRPSVKGGASCARSSSSRDRSRSRRCPASPARAAGAARPDRAVPPTARRPTRPRTGVLGLGADRRRTRSRRPPVRARTAPRPAGRHRPAERPRRHRLRLRRARRARSSTCASRSTASRSPTRPARR